MELWNYGTVEPWKKRRKPNYCISDRKRSSHRCMSRLPSSVNVINFFFLSKSRLGPVMDRSSAEWRETELKLNGNPSERILLISLLTSRKVPPRVTNVYSAVNNQHSSQITTFSSSIARLVRRWRVGTNDKITSDNRGSALSPWASSLFKPIALILTFVSAVPRSFTGNKPDKLKIVQQISRIDYIQ